VTRREKPCGSEASAERGSILIVALIYLVAVGVTIGALAGWAANDLGNSTHFTSVRSEQDAARSVAELAMQNIRYTPMLASTQTLNASPPNYCWGAGPTSGISNIDGYSMYAWCSTAWNPTSAATRVVTVSVCPTTQSAPSCAATPYLKVVVTFDDYPPGGAAPISGSCTLWSWCGQGETINAWIW